MANPSNLPPPPLDTAMAPGDGKAAPVWGRWLQLLHEIVHGVINAGLFLTKGNSADTPGDATLNTPAGKSALAAGHSIVTITNSLVSEASLVLVTKMDTDATATDYRVTPFDGGFSFTAPVNATAAVKFAWLVIN